MKKALILGLMVMCTTIAHAGLLQYNNSTGSDAGQWIHMPDGAPDYMDPGDGYVQWHDASDDSIIASLGTDTVNDGYIEGNVSFGAAGETWQIYAVAVLTSGTYAGATYTFGTGPSVFFDTGGEFYTYDSFGNPSDGSGWDLVPEPGTWALFGIGLVTLIGSRIRRQRS